MEILTLVLIGLGFLLNIFVTRYFVKSLYQKIVVLHETDNTEKSDAYTSPNPALPVDKSIPVAPKSLFSGFDKPAKNTVMDTDENEVDLNEDTPMVVPPDVKFEVEGGDSIVPPGYTAKPN